MKSGTNLLVETIKDATVVTFQDAALLDAIRIQNTGTALFELVERQNRLRIVLDFHNVRSLSSSMLGVLLTLKNKLEDARGRMVLCGLAKDLRRLFEMTALDRVFQFAPDADQALAALGVIAAG
ncbi:MAG TPA: STAS domain-containing protein [Phycisphaerae bacterium]|nr:STAS domain-containing protein [Phycisphaerae bacterium]